MAGGGRVAKLETRSMITQPDEVYSQAMDENAVLGGLKDKSNPTRRAAVIEELRASVRRNGGHLLFEDRHGLFHVFQSSLCDNDPNVRLRCIEFISEIVPEFGTDLDNCMSLILPHLVSNLGNHTVSVKKSAIQTLHVYMRNSSNVGAVFNAIIEHGLESEDKRTRTESLVALPILITPNLAHEDLFVLTKALIGILESASRPEPTVLSLDRIRNVVGEEKFDDYLRRLPGSQQKLCAQAIQNWGHFYREDMEKINLRKAKSASHISTNGVVVEDEEAYTNGEKHNLDRGHTIAVTKGYAAKESLHPRNEEVEFGFVPQSIIVKLKDQSNWRVRAQGIEELKNAMGYLGDPSPVLPHLASLFGLLLDFLDDINFKITVTSLQIIGLLIAKLGQNVEPFLKPLVNTLTNKLGDNKIVIRQENMRVLMHLMQILSPKPVLSVLTASLQHPKSKVREETLNVVIGALLTFPRSDFDLPELTNAIAPALADSKRKVRQAALEAFAVIAQAMGPGHLRPIVSAVDKIELTKGGDGVMAAVQARLARRQLPRLNSDGLVEYAIPVPTSGTVRGQSSGPRGADIEWVMAGTGGSSSADVTNSARSTPGLNDSMNNSGPSPRRYYSAGKNRLPWEELKDTSLQGDSSEQKPQPVKNSWVPGDLVNDRSPKRGGPQRPSNINTPNSAPTTTTKLTTSSYTEKFLRNRHTHQSPADSHMPKPPDSSSSSSSSSSYAEIHRTKVKKEKTKPNLNATAPASSGSGSSSGGAGGSYALLYKRGTIHAKPKASSSAEPAIGEVQPKETLTRNAHSTTPTALHSHAGFVPADDELFFSHRKSYPNALSYSWPDWTEASSGRPFGRLSPVSHGHVPNTDFDSGFDVDPDGKRSEPHTPVHIKPQLARSASKIRGLKNPDLVDGITGIDPFERSTPLAPVTRSPGNALETSQPHKDALKQVHDQVNRRAQRVPPVGSENNDVNSALNSSNGLIKANGAELSNEMLSNKDSPFSSKPRMARTPVQSKRTPAPQPGHTHQNSSNNLDIKGVKIKSKDIGDKHPALNSGKSGDDLSNVTSGVGSSISGSDETTDMRNVSVVGQGIVGLEKDRTDSIDDKVGPADSKKLVYEPEEYDDDDDDDDDDDEDDDDDDDDEEDDDEEDDEDENDKEDDIVPDDLENIDDSSDSDSDLELETGAEEGRKRDMTPRTMRKSLSKSTRERMERKRQMEEERQLKEQQRIETLEREKARQLKIKKDEEEHLRKKIMKEQQELEKMLQKKEKERELEKQKQRLLQEQLLQQERALTERLLKQQEELEEIEREKQREREREKERMKEKMKQKQLKLQREREEEEDRRKEEERRKEEDRKKDEISGRAKLNQRKEMELKKKLELEESDKRRRQQQASKDMKETLEDKVKDLSITGSSTPLKQPSGKSSRKKNQMSSPHSDRDESYATTEDPLDSRRHFSASSGSSTAAIWEVSLDDLQPFPNPDSALKTAFKYLANTEDWESKCEGLQVLRRLSKNHPDSFGLQLHAVILAVVAEVKNLRSQVSRAAICCLGDMFTCLGRQMDMDLEATCKILLLKSGETSGFIRDDNDKALSAMVCNVTPTRALVAITSNGCGNRNVSIRKTAAQVLSVLAERIGTNRLMSGAKDVTDKILPAAAQFATDGGSETRYYGRKILYTIHEHPDFDKLLMKHVAANQHRQIQDIVSTMKTKGLGDPPSDHTSARQRKHPGSSHSGKGSVRSSYDAGSSVVNSPVASRESTRSGKSRDVVDGEEHIPEVLSLLSSNDWKERLQGLDLFVELAERNPQGLGAKFTKVFDNLLPRLTDSNSKVNLYALQCLPKILPSMSGQSGALVPPIVNALTHNLASKNASIFSTTDDALTAMTAFIDNVSLVQPFCTTSQFGNSRVKPVIIEKLCLIIEKVHTRKPQVINRYVVPLIWQLLGSTSTGSAASGTGDIKNATIRLTNVVYSCLGKSLVDQSSSQVPRIQERLKDIINA